MVHSVYWLLLISKPPAPPPIKLLPSEDHCWGSFLHFLTHFTSLFNSPPFQIIPKLPPPPPPHSNARRVLEDPVQYFQNSTSFVSLIWWFPTIPKAPHLISNPMRILFNILRKLNHYPIFLNGFLMILNAPPPRTNVVKILDEDPLLSFDKCSSIPPYSWWFPMPSSHDSNPVSMLDGNHFSHPGLPWCTRSP